MFDTNTILIKKDNEERFKILCVRTKWIDLYSLDDGEIITKCTENLTADFFVRIPDAEFSEGETQQ